MYVEVGGGGWRCRGGGERGLSRGGCSPALPSSLCAQPLLVVDPLTAQTSAELMPLHNVVAIRIALPGPASASNSPNSSPPGSPRLSASSHISTSSRLSASSLRSSAPTGPLRKAMCEAAVERAAVERAVVGCEVMVEWMAGRLDVAHPFLVDYARLHVGRQYREALIQMIGRSFR